MKRKETIEKGTVKKILIVEDEVIIGMAMAADLEDLGYQVTEVVCSGNEALQAIKNETVDLVLLDIKLRGAMDGIETLARIREIANPHVVIISGNSEAQTFNRVQDITVDGFMVKPVNIQELQQILEVI